MPVLDYRREASSKVLAPPGVSVTRDSSVLFTLPCAQGGSGDRRFPCIWDLPPPLSLFHPFSRLHEVGTGRTQPLHQWVELSK